MNADAPHSLSRLACLVVEPAVGRLSPANERAYHPNASGDWAEDGLGAGENAELTAWGGVHVVKAFSA